MFLKIAGGLNAKAAVIFLSAALLLIGSHYSIVYRLPSDLFGGIKFLSLIAKDLREYILWFSSDIFLLFLIPVLIIKLFFKEKIINYGFQFGDAATGLKYCALFIFPMAVIIWFATGSQSIIEFYPTVKSTAGSWNLFLVFQAGLIIYMIAWEFFWRGFLLFGLEEKFGIYSIFIQMIPFVLLHTSKPYLESIGAVFGALVLGYLAYRTRSIWYGILVHFAVMFATDFISILRLRVDEYGVEFKSLSKVISSLFL